MLQGYAAWPIIANSLKKPGLSLGWVSCMDREGRTICVVDAHHDDPKGFVTHADEKSACVSGTGSANRAGSPMLNSARRRCPSPRCRRLVTWSGQ
jgi:hypothetical protein